MGRFRLVVVPCFLMLACSSSDPPAADSAIRVDSVGDARSDGIQFLDGADDGAADSDLSEEKGIGSCLGRWCWESPLPMGDALLAVWPVGANELVAVGAAGIALHFDGSNWRREQTPTDKTLNSLWGTDDVLFAVGEEGVILKRQGGQWAKVPSGSGNTLHSVWGLSATHLFAVGESSTFLEFKGQYWATKPVDLSYESLYGVWAASATDVYAVGSGRKMARYDGLTLKAGSHPLSTAYAIWGTSASNVYVGGQNGSNKRIYHHDGSNWTAQAVDIGYTVTSIHGTSSDSIFAGSDSGQTAHFDGTSWSTAGLHGDRYLVIGSIFALDGGEAFAVGAGGMIQRFKGGWSSLYPTASSTTNSINGFWGQAGQRPTIAIADDGKLLRWQNGGWIAQQIPSSYELNAIWGVSEDDFYMVGAQNSQGMIRRVTSGQVYEEDLSAAGYVQSLRAIWGSDANNIVAIGKNGQILRYDGTQWQHEKPEGVGTNLNAIWGSSASDIYVVGDSKTVLHYDGTKWSSITVPDTSSFHAVWGSSASNVYIAGSHVMRFDGKVWRRVLFEHSGHLNAIWGSGPSDVWLGSSYAARLFHFDGKRWNEAGTRRANEINTIWGTPDRIYLGGSDGMILEGKR